MRAKPLSMGGAIGICSPSQVAEKEEYRPWLNALESLGFQVVTADNLYKATYGYLASPEERGADFNQLVRDPRVELILFGGGEGSNELLPYLDFQAIRENPKQILAYSDATTILNAVWANSGLEVYYGQSPRTFQDQTDFDREQFFTHIVKRDTNTHAKASPWISLRAGRAEGILIGGYLRNFALQLGSAYFPIDLSGKYILFLEDNICFGNEAYVSAMLTHIELFGFMDCVNGLLFGHYDTEPHPYLYDRLARLGARYNIPVAYCDDFGHGVNHAILEIGRTCSFETVTNSLIYD